MPPVSQPTFSAQKRAERSRTQTHTQHAVRKTPNDNVGIAQTKKLPIKASFVDARNNRTHFSPKKRVFACAISSFVFIIFFPFFNTPGCRYSGNRRGAKKIARFPPLDCLIPPLPYDVFQGKHSLFPFISSPRPPFFGRNQKK